MRIRSLPERFHRFTGFPLLFWLAVVGCSVLSMVLLAGRLAGTRQAGHLSLVWDLFLAWLPVAPALVFYRMAHRPAAGRWVTWGVGATWLLFFPNAPYLVTQMIHLNPAYGPSIKSLPPWLDQALPGMSPQPSPEWFDLLLLASIFVTGLLLSFVSLRMVERAMSRRVGSTLAVAVSGWIVLVASFGVALGRFARLNSWDVFSQPLHTAEQISHWIVSPRVGISTLVLAALLTMVYVAAVQAGRKEPERSTRRSG